MRGLRRLRRWLGWSIVAVLAAFAFCVSIELLHEAHERARLTANDTYFSMGGRQVRYRLVGAGLPGPTIVLVTGGGGSLEQWDGVQTALATVAPVLAYDRGGMGFSDALDGHDAVAEGEELLALLQMPAVKPPFLFVSYSSGAMVVRYLLPRHPEIVAGKVFIDPVVPEGIAAIPESRRQSYKRIYLRSSVQQTFKAITGYLRFRKSISDRKAPATTPTDETVAVILTTFHHWLGTSEDVLDLDDSMAEVLANPGLGNGPVGVLSTIDNAWVNERAQDLYDGEVALSKTSPNGIFHLAHLDHSKLLVGNAAPDVIDLIRAIEDQARSAPTSASAP